jgi:hypothetical protein
MTRAEVAERLERAVLRAASRAGGTVRSPAGRTMVATVTWRPGGRKPRSQIACYCVSVTKSEFGLRQGAFLRVRDVVREVFFHG